MRAFSKKRYFQKKDHMKVLEQRKKRKKYFL